MTYFLCIIISSISLSLIIEAGAFLSTGIHGYILAFLLESVVLVSMISTSDSRDFNIFRKVLIGSVLIVVTGAASLNAVKNVAMISAPESVMFRIKEVNRDIESLRASLASLHGQPKNSAITSGKIRELLEKKSELMKRHRPDTRLATINFAGSLIPVLIRVLLQIGNLFLITVLKNRFSEKPLIIQMPDKSLSRQIVPVQENMIAGFTGHCEDKNSETPAPSISRTADEQKICDYITLKGGSICHQKLLESKQLVAGKYDEVLNSLIAAGVLKKNDNFNRAFNIYTLNVRH